MKKMEVQQKYRSTLYQNLCRWTYSFVLTLLIPIALLALFIKSRLRNKEYRIRILERFGFGKRPPKTGGYLFHCVSVGEVVAASCVIKALMAEKPDMQFTITTTTPTGSARVISIFGEKVHHFYLPYDLHFAMGNLIRRVKPTHVIITEVELWPNLIHACWRRGIPISVMNARMTEKSAQRYSRFPNLFGTMFHKLSHVCAQGQRDYDNYIKLGLDKNKLTLTNNIKFDQAGATLKSDNDNFLNLGTLSKLIIVAGSTHEGEELALLNAFHELKDKYSFLMVFVPRHPERFETVAQLLATQSLNWCRTTLQQNIEEKTEVVLLDEMGKLTEAYGVADIAFVGGSLVDKGGHNALEPAAKAIPILMGQYTYNNPEICQTLVDCGALTLVKNEQALIKRLDALLNSEPERKKTGKAGLDILLKNQGAVAQTLSALYSVE